LLGLETALVFVLMTLGTALIVFRAWNLRQRSLGRIAPRAATVTPYLPSPSLVWSELVNWIGSFVPASPKNLPRLKQRLMRAGFRNPSAVRFFHGARAVATLTFSLAGLFLGLHFSAAPRDLALLAAGAGFTGYMAPMQYLLFRIRRRKRAVEKGLPNALDLMVVCVESGLGLDQTTLQVARELHAAHPEICEEFAVMNLEIRAGQRRVEALHNLAGRTGVDDLKKLVAVLVQTDRFGTSIAQSLRGHSEYMRTMARQRAEEKAAKIAVKLVFPIFFCVLPSLFVVTVGPMVTQFVRDIMPMMRDL
jgi:tight adherence protein C